MCLKLSEHLLDATEGGDEGVDFLFGVVEREGGTNGSLYTKAVHERFSTMVTCANSYAEAVEKCAQIEVVNATNVEGKNRREK